MSPEKRVPSTEKVEEMIEKSSLVPLYIGVILGALMGVIGNIFVEYLFNGNLLGSAVSGLVFVVATWALWQQTKKYAKNTQTEKGKEKIDTIMG